MPSGKIIHFNGISKCTGSDEVGYAEEHSIDEQFFRELFFKDFELNYILDYAVKNKIHFHIVTHSTPTKTCKEKALITGLPLERVIKGFYLQDKKTQNIYALAIPGEFNYSISHLAKFLETDIKDAERRIGKSDILPVGIKYGTCHPFVNDDSFKEMPLKNILFDVNFAKKRLIEGGIDDFSFTTHPSNGLDNERTSIQINYNDAKDILKNKFGEDIVREIELV